MSCNVQQASAWKVAYRWRKYGALLILVPPPASIKLFAPLLLSPPTNRLRANLQDLEDMAGLNLALNRRED